MKLGSADGSSLELTIDGYEFPTPSGYTNDVWGDNWLYIVGRLRLPDGRRFEFRDPCLTVGEARAILSWLENVRRGAQVPSVAEFPSEIFTEPNIAFDLEDQSDARTVFRVYLSAESEPPFVIAGGPGMYANFIRVEVPAPQLDLAIASWRSELQECKVR